jgi:hypothetical protein
MLMSLIRLHDADLILSKHGTFRPKLLQLVSSNPSDEIKSLTKSVFDTYSRSSELDRPALVTQLAKLKGVGPATASLILCTCDPETTIFFGDEVFRWLSWDEPSKGPKGWTRQISYTAKEYRRFDELATDLRKRLNVKAIDIEKVGYVLGKEKADVDLGMNSKEGNSVESKEENSQKSKDQNKAEAPAPKTVTASKRKIESTAPEAKGRRSKRLASS